MALNDYPISGNVDLKIINSLITRLREIEKNLGNDFKVDWEDVNGRPVDVLPNGPSGLITGTDKLLLDNAVPNSRTINTYPLTSDVSLNKSDVGLSEVDNTSDLDKPLSTASRMIFDGLDGMGVISGMVISINTDNTKIDISSGSYHYALDGDINYPGIIAFPLTYRTTNNVTYLALDPITSLLVEKTSPFTPPERRDYVLLGAVIHSNKLTVNAINNLPDVAVSSAAQLNDFMDGLSVFNKNGNVFYANGANLFINKTFGEIFKKGVNFNIDNKDPHTKDMPALIAPSNIRYRLSDGTEYPDTNSVSLFYESAPGIRTALPISRFTIQRIALFSSNLVRIQYGQAIYNTIALAQQAIFSEPFVTEQNIAENGLLRGYLIIKGSVDSLINPDLALFIQADRFGQFAAGGAGGITSLQQAYNNSETPEIITNSTLGSFSIRRGSALDTDNVLEIQNGAGTIVSKIDAIGNVSGNIIITNELTANGSRGTTTQVLHGSAVGKPTFSPIIEDDISLSNNIINNVTTLNHGFTPILSGAANQFLSGMGTWVTPSGITNSYVSQSFSNVTSVVVIHGFGTFPVIQVLNETNSVIIPLEITNNTINQTTITLNQPTSGTVLASVGSPQKANLVIISADYNATYNDKIISSTASGITITLPTAVNYIGHEYVIDNASLGAIRIDTFGTETISGLPYQIINSDDTMHVYSNGVNWRIM